MLNIVLNLIVFVVIPFLCYRVLLNIKKAITSPKKSNDEELSDEECRIENIREAWPRYSRLYLNIEEEIKDCYKIDPVGPCAYVTTRILDEEFKTKTDIQVFKDYTKKQQELNKKKDEKDRVYGIPRKMWLKKLMNNFEYKGYLGERFTVIDDKKKRNKKKQKGALTIESLFNAAEKHNYLLLALTQEHIGVIVYAKGNTYIDLAGPTKVFTLDPNKDKILIIKSIKSIPEDEEQKTSS